MITSGAGNISNLIFIYQRGPTHLSKEINPSSYDEGGDGGANHSKQGDGANVLEEVTLNIHGDTSEVLMIFMRHAVDVSLLYNM